MNIKLRARQKIKNKLRKKISDLNVYRLSVHRTPKHIYAQVFFNNASKVVVSASSVEKEFANSVGGNCEAAAKVGSLIASRAQEAGIEKVVFDRSWFKYHGRVKSLAESARKGGLIF